MFRNVNSFIVNIEINASLLLICNLFDIPHDSFTQSGRVDGSFGQGRNNRNEAFIFKIKVTTADLEFKRLG